MKLLISAGFLLCSVAAYAQAGPTSVKSADEITCELTGDCAKGSETASATRGAEPTRGFSIRRQTVAAPAPHAAARAYVRRPVAPAIAYAARPMAAAAQPGHSNLAVGFVLGSAELDASGKAQATKLLDALRGPKLSGKKILVAGHTDARGSREYNLDLSQRRADSLVSYLVQNGIDRSLLEAHGYGFDKLLPNVDSKSASNRRVEISVVD